MTERSGEFHVFNRVARVFTAMLLIAYSISLYVFTIDLLISSCSFFISTVAYTTIGIVLNADNVTRHMQLPSSSLLQTFISVTLIFRTDTKRSRG